MRLFKNLRKCYSGTSILRCSMTGFYGCVMNFNGSLGYIKSVSFNKLRAKSGKILK